MAPLPSGSRRYTPNSHSKTVQLYSPDGGEEHVGYFRVPSDAVTFKEHTNEVLRYDRVVVSKIKEWIDWKGRLGLVMTTKPTVYVPTDAPRLHVGADPLDDGDMRVYVRATFRRGTPAFMSLDTFLDRKDAAERYGVNLEAKRLASNALSSPVERLVANGERQPMDLAAQRRAGLRLKRMVQVNKDEYGDTVAVGATVEPQ